MSTWQAVDEVRPVPEVIARLPEVRAVRWGGAAVLTAVVLWLPTWLSPSDALLASSVLIFGIIGLSLLVLTGWAGQVSLGQMGFVGLGVLFCVLHHALHVFLGQAARGLNGDYKASEVSILG